ncbi:LysM domain-containing protein [Prochlorococcus sp. MIT 1223]|uniref:LysM peptidoglycan-binding domain-containing protein n=1 Tax=Prochlorococcus sp. MIT 1223 TaxID=3096217 RepID=UPI002A75293D|nr:LysM domain-containing protein [Prochlorococcus sp. MIT 1223]
MIKRLFFTLSFILLTNSAGLASEITVKEGDTLTKIANENNLTIKEILDLNNISDANQIKKGQIIKLPERSIYQKFHVMKQGESLSMISEMYNVKRDDLIKLNNIKNPDLLYLGQKILISEEADLNEEKELTTEKEMIADKKVIDISINNKVPLEWKTYGPLRVNWSSLEKKDGNFIAKSMHKSGKPLYIAVKCSSQIINRTGLNGNWREWITPQEAFEYKLVNDICESS